MKKFFILAGEASGDIYGAALAEELRRIGKERGEEVSVMGMGGPAMRAAGVKIVVDSTELGVIGVFEVLKHIFTFIRIYFLLVRTAKKERPDAVIPIDYPGLNLMFAKAMYRAGIPVFWYVSPQVWLWGKRRLPTLAKVCSKMLVIFPFEEKVYAATPLRAKFVGHPITESAALRDTGTEERDPDVFLLLPGSRRQEVERLLDPMLETVIALHEKHGKLEFKLAAPRERIAGICRKRIEKFRRRRPELPEIDIVVGETGRLLLTSGTGIAACGTVTLECALVGLPLVVGYKLNLFTLFMVKLMLRHYRGSLTIANIVAERAVYREFIQNRFRVGELLPAVEEILPGGSRRAEVEADMREVAVKLEADSPVPASRRAAEEIYRG